MFADQASTRAFLGKTLPAAPVISTTLPSNRRAAGVAIRSPRPP